MEDLTRKFSGLPLENLTCQPLIEVARGQAALCQVYLDYINKLAHADGEPGSATRVIKFNLECPVTDGSGTVEKKSVMVEAPLISLVPVPSFTMQDATVNFSMEGSTPEVDTTESSAEVSTETSC